MGNEEHNIKLFRKTELYELEYDTKYEGRIKHESRKQVEEELLACIEV
jgi:hypothetical protein